MITLLAAFILMAIAVFGMENTYEQQHEFKKIMKKEEQNLQNQIRNLITDTTNYLSKYEGQLNDQEMEQKNTIAERFDTIQ